MSIIRKKKNEWTVVDNKIVDDPRLSMQALGLLVYMLSKPDGWEFRQEQLMARFDIGRDGFRTAMHALTAAGYVSRIVERNRHGQLTTTTVVSEEPSGEVTGGGFSTAGEATGGEPTALVMTDSVKTEEEEEREAAPPPAQPGKKAGNPAVTLEQWLKLHADEKIVIPGGAIEKWFHEAGISPEHARMAWDEFKSRYTTFERQKTKKYRDWRLVFLNALNDNWLGLWYFTEEGYKLSSKGVLASRRGQEVAA